MREIMERKEKKRIEIIIEVYKALFLVYDWISG